MIVVGRRPAFTLVRIVVLVITCLVVFNFVLWPIRVTGPSMLPTYQDRTINFVNHLAYRWSDPQRYDVVAIRFSGRSVMLMKRVVGLPGEVVAFEDGKLLINGQPLPEPYVKYPCRWDMAAQKLGTNEFFVVGDNRVMSTNDHYFGIAERVRILGKVVL